MSRAMGRDVVFSVKFREIREEEVGMYRGAFFRSAGELHTDKFSEYTTAGKVFTAEVLCCLDDGMSGTGGPGGASWWWSQRTFIDRFFLMQEMYRDFLGPAEGSLELLDELHSDVNLDPFLGLPDDELVGVAYLYPDALQYMLDIQELLPIVNFKGFVCGGIQLSVRAWIDVMEIAPAYLSVDKECKLENFVNQKLIMRFMFENLQDIPAKLCCYNRLTFKFFYHVGSYSTPYTSEKTRNPLIGRPLIIEQIITPDFIDFIQRGSIEFEVWGKQPMKLTCKGSSELPCSDSDVLGDPDVFPVVAIVTSNEDEVPQAKDFSEEITALKSEIESLKAALERKNKEARSYKVELESTKTSLKLDSAPPTSENPLAQGASKLNRMTTTKGKSESEGSKSCRIS
jgi:hypothetical protein